MIVLNMVVRNAADTILKALESVKPAVDYVVIGFAGESDDDTRNIVTTWLNENFPARHVVEDFDFVDFADARNKVLAATPEGFEWMLWMDADDFIMGAADIPKVAKSVPAGVGSVQFPYVYQTDENGNPTVVHDRERLIRLALNWRWERPVHETLRTDVPHDIIRVDNATWIHRWKVNQETRHDRNMELLRAYYESNPEDRRTTLYIAHALYSVEDWANARDWFADFASDPTNDLEGWQACVFAGDCSQQLHDFDAAVAWYYQALDTRPEIIDSYIGLAQCFTQMGQHGKALHWYKMADDKQMPPSQLFILPGRYTFNRWAYEHKSMAALGFYEAALEICGKALEYTKGQHHGFTFYFNGYKEALLAKQSMESLRHLVYHLQNRGDALNAMEILKFAPKNITEQPEFEQLQQAAYKAVEHVFNPDLDIYKSEEHYAGQTASEFETEPEKMERVAAVFARLEKVAAERAKLGKKLTVVDIGAGDGGIAVRMAEKYGWLVTVIDSNQHNIELARERAERRGVLDKLRFVCGDARSLAADEVGRHDVAICLEVIEHVLDPAQLVMFGQEVADRLIITTPHQAVGAELKNTPDGVHLHHVREFDFGMLIRMASGLGATIETLTTAYSEGNLLPGYGSWLLELKAQEQLKMPVVFYVGPQVEAWTPEQVNEEGIGGSETAVVEMAKQFRKAGHAVFVYGMVDGIWDGVFYRHYRHFTPEGPAAGAGALLFVSSRVPEVFDAKVNAAVKWLWCHDNNYSNRLTPERAEEINTILVLSEWQKRVFETDYPFAADKLVVTGNGINPERFADADAAEFREPHRFVWSSSFDRGLERVLGMWPEIRDKWADAELYVYYGFETADAIYGTRNQAYNEFRDRLVEALQQDGVKYVGRISQDKMATEFARAGFWLYPTTFNETYCITALEVQACGVIPVVSAAGALPERVAPEIEVLVDADDEAYLEALSGYNEGTGELRAALRKHALSFTWEKIHKQWKGLIDKGVKKNIKQRQAEVAQAAQWQTLEHGANSKPN